MTPFIDGSTRVFALLGDPVDHSLSPAMQNAAFASEEVNGIYVPLRCRSADVAGLLRGLARSGGGGNVTLPHKELAATVLDRPSEAVRVTGACNTFWLEEGDVHGDNTDVEGLRRALRDFLGGSLSGARVLLLGAGGAARAALKVLDDEGVDEIRIWNRTPERARALIGRLEGDRARLVEALAQLENERFDLLIQATRVGLRDDDPLLLDPAGDTELGAVMDLVYRLGGTRLVRRARDHSIPARDGVEMLVHQGAAAFQRWWKRPGPVAVMREALKERGSGGGAG